MVYKPPPIAKTAYGDGSLSVWCVHNIIICTEQPVPLLVVEFGPLLARNKENLIFTGYRFITYDTYICGRKAMMYGTYLPVASSIDVAMGAVTDS